MCQVLCFMGIGGFTHEQPKQGLWPLRDITIKIQLTHDKSSEGRNGSDGEMFRVRKGTKVEVHTQGCD